MWRASSQSDLDAVALEYTSDGKVYADAHPTLDKPDERALLCSTDWVAHEQQRKRGGACRLRRSFGQRSALWTRTKSEFCERVASSARSIFFFGDSLVRQQFHMLVCTCRDYVQLGSASHAYWRCDTSSTAGRRCAHNDSAIMLRTPAGQTVWLHWRFTTGEGLRNAQRPHARHPFPRLPRRAARADVLVFGVGAWLTGLDVGAWNSSLWAWSDYLLSERVVGRSVCARSRLRAPNLRLSSSSATLPPPCSRARPRASQGWNTLPATFRRPTESGAGWRRMRRRARHSTVSRLASGQRASRPTRGHARRARPCGAWPRAPLRATTTTPAPWGWNAICGSAAFLWRSCLTVGTFAFLEPRSRRATTPCSISSSLAAGGHCSL